MHSFCARLCGVSVMSNDRITASQPEQKCKRAHTNTLTQKMINRKEGEMQKEKNYLYIRCASLMFEVK